MSRWTHVAGVHLVSVLQVSLLGMSECECCLCGRVHDFFLFFEFGV